MKTAFIFPGQGAQAVGMGADLYEAFEPARTVFDIAEQATGLPLKKACFEGPADELARTDICQPAILTVSAAALAVLGELLGPERIDAFRPAALAGLSLGEYTALYAAEAMDLSTAVKLLAERGRLMQQAAEAAPGGMVSVIGLDEPAATALAEEAAEGSPLTCANFNCPGQIVLSGAADACKRAEQLADKHNARAAIPLDVAGAFHSELMRPAADGLAGTLAAVEFREPKTPVLANVDAAPYASASEIPAKLLAQLTSAVRWQQCMERMLADGIERFYEIGPGRVLAGLMRRIDRKADVIVLNGADDIRRLAGETP